MEKFKYEIKKYLKTMPDAKMFFQELMTTGSAYLIGGFPREFLDRGYFTYVRDIDVAVDVEKRDIWEKLLKSQRYRRNRFGGYKIFFRYITFDVWEIKKTWGFQHRTRDRFTDYAHLLADTVFLNIDAVVYDYKNEHWDMSGYIDAVRQNMLDVVLEENPQIALNILRSYVLQKKYRMTLSERLKRIILRQREEIPDLAQHLYQLQERRYGKNGYSMEDFSNWIERETDSIKAVGESQGDDNAKIRLE